MVSGIVTAALHWALPAVRSQELYDTQPQQGLNDDWVSAVPAATWRGAPAADWAACHCEILKTCASRCALPGALVSTSGLDVTTVSRMHKLVKNRTNWDKHEVLLQNPAMGFMLLAVW